MMSRKAVIYLFIFISSHVLFEVKACMNYKLQIRQLDEKNVAALIIARGGSKGIPLKNISKIGNRTLISNSIEVIKRVLGFNSIWVSTDSTDIFQAVQGDCENIHWRTEKFASDTASSISAVQEFLSFHPEIDAIGLIQCTSPFLKETYLIEALKYLYSQKECVFSITRSFKLRWGYKLQTLIPLNFNTQSRPRRQDWKGEIVENGMFYFANRYLINQGVFQNDNLTSNSMDKWKFIVKDIEDWLKRIL